MSKIKVTMAVMLQTKRQTNRRSQTSYPRRSTESVCSNPFISSPAAHTHANCFCTRPWKD